MIERIYIHSIITIAWYNLQVKIFPTTSPDHCDNCVTNRILELPSNSTSTQLRIMFDRHVCMSSSNSAAMQSMQVYSIQEIMTEM